VSPTLGRILIVDDETPVREVLGEYFTTQGYAVEAVGSGNDALAAIGRARPDLVLLDIRMPGIDGVETLRRIRALDEGVAVIMVTANEDVGLARETLKLGAFDYVAKPFDFGYLDRAVAAGLVQASASTAWDKPHASTAWDKPHASNAWDKPHVSTAWDRPRDTAGDAWDGLAVTVFQAARGMEPAARASTGARLEDAALAAAREAAAGRPAVAGERLGELALLLTIAAELRDLPDSDRARIEAACEAARRTLEATG
jgi:CheY-like chemotaxis protein